MNGEPLLPLEVHVIAVVTLLALLAWVVRLVRTQRLGLRDSLLWIFSSGAALVLMAFPSCLRSLAHLLGVQVPANALFAVALLYVVVNLLSGTIVASRNAERTRRLAQECALLRAEIEELRARVAASGPKDAG
jgi:hypothetical protein